MVKRFVIVGGGISGLSLAYRLQQAMPNAAVTLLERDSYLGGKIRTEHHDGFAVETGANGFPDTKPSTLQLCRDLGLTDKLTPASDAANRNRFLFHRGKLRVLPSNPLAFLGSDILSLRGKVGILAERFRKSRPASADESVEEFARRRAGREVAEVLVDAFVTGIHAGDPNLLSVRAAFPRLAALESQYGSVLKGLIASARERRREADAKGTARERTTNLWSFREGLGLLVDSLRTALRGTVHVGIGVKRLEHTQAGWKLHADGRDSWDADAVVLACPAYQQSAILADFDAELADLVAGIPYNRVAVVALGYRRIDVPVSLDGFGYLTPRGSRGDVLGVQWCSSTYPCRAPESMVLLRAICGGWHRPHVVGWEDDRLVQTVAAELRVTLKIAAPPVFRRIIRWDRAIPQYIVGHLDRVAAIELRAARYPGLILAGNAYHGVSLNDCTEQAQLLTARLKGMS